MDSTALKIFHNRRINQHKVFEDLAARGTTLVDWFFGCKLHLVVNDRGELLNMILTPANTDDRTPVPQLLQVNGLSSSVKRWSAAVNGRRLLLVVYRF